MERRWQGIRDCPSRVGSAKPLKTKHFFRAFQTEALFSPKFLIENQGICSALDSSHLRVQPGWNYCMESSWGEQLNWKCRREGKIIPKDLILQGAKQSSLKSLKVCLLIRRSPGPGGTVRLSSLTQGVTGTGVRRHNDPLWGVQHTSRALGKKRPGSRLSYGIWIWRVQMDGPGQVLSLLILRSSVGVQSSISIFPLSPSQWPWNLLRTHSLSPQWIVVKANGIWVLMDGDTS